MTIANVSPATAVGLPPALRTAQEAIHLAEVQDMLRRLAEYRLGIFMPHMHDGQTGQFEPLPDDVIQVESGLRVSFEPTKDIATQADRFLPVAWVWRAGAATPAAACEMVQDEAPCDTARAVKHTHAAMDSR